MDVTQIPTLGSTSNPAVVLPQATFAAFKEDEQFSFVRAYSPTVTEITGYRHAVIRYRDGDSKKGTVSTPAKMVTIPQLVLPEEYMLLDERATKVILGMFEDEQDEIIRNLIDEKQASKITWDVLTLDCVLSSLTAVRISKRLTKEQIENWARIAFKDVCEVRAKQIAEAKQFNAEQTAKQVAGTLNAYVALAMKLAAPVPNVGENDARALQNLLLVGKLDDDMSKVIRTKLHQMLNPKVVENVDL